MSDGPQQQNLGARSWGRWILGIGIIVAAIWIWHANGLPGLSVKDGIYACSGTDYRGAEHEYLGEIRNGEWYAWDETTPTESDLPDSMGLARDTPRRTSLFNENATEAATINAGAVECHWVRGS